MATARKPTVGEQLLADGVRIKLGGDLVRLRADLPAMIALEAQWGSLKAWFIEIQKGVDGKFYTAVGHGVAACIRNLPVNATELMEITPDAMREYADGLTAAFRQAGFLGDEETGQGNPPGPTPNGLSPGSDSSTSASSAADSAQPTSGA